MLLCYNFNIFNFVKKLNPSIFKIKLFPKCKLDKCGHLSKFVMWVIYFYYSVIIVILPKFGFSPGFDFVKVPLRSNASLISFGGCYFICWADPKDLQEVSTCIFPYLFLSVASCYYSLSISYYLKISFYLAKAMIFCICYYLNIYVCLFSNAFELAATITTIHYWVSNPKSSSYYPFIYVIVSH